MGINTGGTSEVEGGYDLDDLFSDECVRAIMEMNERGRIAYERAQRSEKIKLIVDNTQPHD